MSVGKRISRQVIVVCSIAFAYGIFCANMPTALAQMAQEHSQEGAEHVHQEEAQGTPSVEEGNLFCPVTGMKASKDVSYIHEGKTYYFCCPDCIGQFKASPEKYIANLKSTS